MSQPALDMASIESVSFPKGKVIFRQGDKGDGAYLLDTGLIGIFREVEGKKVPITTIGSGDLFGEMAVIDGSPRTETAYAAEDCKVKMISVKTMINTKRGADPFIRSLIHMLVKNLRSVHDSFTPRTRSFADAINALQRHRETLTKFSEGNVELELKSALAQKLKDFAAALAGLRAVAAQHKGQDRRANAVPAEAELLPT